MGKIRVTKGLVTPLREGTLAGRQGRVKLALAALVEPSGFGRGAEGGVWLPDPKISQSNLNIKPNIHRPRKAQLMRPAPISWFPLPLWFTGFQIPSNVLKQF
jgi:hypothetical protein